MNDQIQNILRKGKNENATESDRKKMLALFHQPEKEFLLKEELFEELENSFEIEEVSNDMQKVF